MRASRIVDLVTVALGVGEWATSGSPAMVVDRPSDQILRMPLIWLLVVAVWQWDLWCAVWWFMD